MSLDQEIRDFADAFNDGGRGTVEYFQLGTVTNVAAGGAQGGVQPLVTVNVNGTALEATCNRTATYANGDRVLVLIRNATPIVCFPLGNFPPVE